MRILTHSVRYKLFKIQKKLIKLIFTLIRWSIEGAYKSFLFWILISSTRHSFKFRGLTGRIAKCSLKEILTPSLFQLWGLSALIKLKSFKLIVYHHLHRKNLSRFQRDMSYENCGVYCIIQYMLMTILNYH